MPVRIDKSGLPGAPVAPYSINIGGVEPAPPRGGVYPERSEGPDAVSALRAQFPILGTLSRGKPLVYLDSGATTQKPQVVIDRMNTFYTSGNANIHRGVYQFSEEASVAYDGTRDTVATFLGGVRPDEIVFVRGTTEAMNLVAQSWLKPRLNEGDSVLVTTMEHHANIVPWQLAGAKTIPIPVLENGELDMVAAEALLAKRPRLLAVTHVSNVLGTVNPIAELCRIAKAHWVPVAVDGAQAVGHFPVDLTTLGADFYCFSGHKLFGPTGVGVLWAKKEHLDNMPPYQGGGDMIDQVTFEKTTFAPAPQKFEAGTPNISGVLGLDAAIWWLGSQDRVAVAAHEEELLEYGTNLLSELKGVRIFGTAPGKVGALAFTVEGVHPHDLASLLDADGICIRAGHHCTQPLHRAFGLTATARASLSCYSTHEDLDALVAGVRNAQKIFA